MLEIELHNQDTRGDPAPCFTTGAEIEIAEQLRHQLEERWPRAIRTTSAFAGTSDEPSR